MLSQPTHSLSYASELEAKRAANVGALQLRPSAERLIPSAGVVRRRARASRSSHVACAASYATAGSLARGASPAGPRRRGQRRQDAGAPRAAGVGRRRPADARRAAVAEAADLEGRDRRRSRSRRRSARPRVWCWPPALVSVSTEIRLETSSQSRATVSARSAVTASTPLPHVTRSVPPNTDVDPVGLRRALDPVGRGRCRDHAARPPGRQSERREELVRTRAHGLKVPEADTILSLWGTGRQTIQPGDLRGRRHLGDRRRRRAGRGADGRGRRRRGGRRAQRACRNPRGDRAADPVVRRRHARGRAPRGRRRRARRRRGHARRRRRRVSDAVAQRTPPSSVSISSSASSNEDVLERVLEQHDPETFHLATDDLERALELLTRRSGREARDRRGERTSRASEVVELERRGVDAVIVPARNVAELVGGAPPAV